MINPEVCHSYLKSLFVPKRQPPSIQHGTPRVHNCCDLLCGGVQASNSSLTTSPGYLEARKQEFVISSISAPINPLFSPTIVCPHAVYGYFNSLLRCSLALTVRPCMGNLLKCLFKNVFVRYGVPYFRSC